MNWKLILLLSLFGVAMGIATVFGFIPASSEFIVWVTVALISAFIVAKKVRTRIFLHGFLAGFIAGMLAPVFHVLFYQAYVVNNPKIVEQFSEVPTNLSPRLFILILAPLISAVYAAFLGLFSVVGAKLLYKSKAPQVVTVEEEPAQKA